MPGFVPGFCAVISGERKGFRAGLLRFLLFALSLPYRAAVALRNGLYDRKLKTVHRPDCRVISVGNLTAGGTGKTPLVEYLARCLLRRPAKVVIVSRGYAAEPGGPSDEKALLRENLPGVPHVAGKDRVRCCLTARREHDARVVLVDDGFQHRRLARDLDIVTVDALNPFGFGHFLPRGLLREPPGELTRADVVVITRSGLVSPEDLGALEKEISKLAPDALLARAVEDVVAVHDLSGKDTPLRELAGRRAAAFCGIGNPEGFRRTVAALGVTTVAFMVYADHHRYAASDLKAVDAAADAEHAEIILTTQKDRVKMPADFPWRHKVLVVKTGMRITRGEEELKRRLDDVVEKETEG
jgi:tetraacyldisaccharide 4'-kinase